MKFYRQGYDKQSCLLKTLYLRSLTHKSQLSWSYTNRCIRPLRSQSDSIKPTAKKVHFNLILVYLGFKTFSHAESVDHTIWPKVLQEVEVEQNERRPVSTSWYQVPSPSSTMRPALVCITFYWRGCSRLSTRGTYSACHPARSARVPP